MQQLHLWTWGYSSFHRMVAFEELNSYSVSWDWVSSWVRNHVREGKMPPALPPTPSLLTSMQGRPGRALASLRLTTVLSGYLGLLGHLTTILGMSCTAVHCPGWGLTTGVMPDGHHLDLSTLHRCTPSLYPEQYPRKNALKIRRAFKQWHCISSIECGRRTFLGQITTEFIQVNMVLI